MIEEKIMQKKDVATKYIPVCFTVAIIITNFLFTMVRGKYFVDSDMASNLIATELFLKEGVILSKNWIYSTELATLQTHLLRIGFLLCKNDWMMVMAITNLLIMTWTSVAVFLFYREVGISNISALWFTGISLCPISYWYMMMVDFPGYYNANIAFVFTVLAIFFKFIDYFSSQHNKLFFLLYWLLSFILGTIAGTFGEKYLLFPYVPILLAVVFTWLLYIRNNPERLYDYKDVRVKTIFYSLFIVMATLIGYVIKVVFLAKEYVFENYTGIRWNYFSINDFLSAISDYLSLFGFQNDFEVNQMARVRPSPELFSFQGIASLFGIVVASCIVIASVRLVIRYKEISLKQQVVILLFICTIIVDGIVFRWTEGHVTGAAYWVMVVPLGFAIIQIANETEKYVFRHTSTIVNIGIIASLVITSMATVKDFQSYPPQGDPNMVNIVDWLEENGYTQGYGSFWDSNVVTMLSNGKIEMWTIYDFQSMAMQPWLQKKAHMDSMPSDDRVFGILGPRDGIDRETFMTYMNTTPGIPEIVYEDEVGYIIVEYK